MNDVIREKLKTLPELSGVYMMLDEYNNIIYVGKAKNLKNRVRQYFHNNVKTDKVSVLVSKITDLKYVITNTEYDALILENNLIKKHNPQYNILLKDDKTYPYIRIDRKSKFPKCEVCRKMRSDGAEYFGPYMLGVSVTEILKLINSVFPIRECTKIPKKECLNYHIDRCLAPCINPECKKEYNDVLDKIVEFLEGDYTYVENLLKEKMQKSAILEEFELAKNYRDTLLSLGKIIRKQSIPFRQSLDIDVFTCVTNGIYSVVNCFIVRGGKFLGGDNYPYSEVDNKNGLTSFIMQYYQRNKILCNEIVVNQNLEFSTELADYLSSVANRKLAIIEPSGGIRKQLVELGEKNASEYLARQLENLNKFEEMTMGAVEQLQKYLNLPRLPLRIECYDISHISGTNKVSSMVVFINGQKANKHYRHFKIKTVVGNNDFASMEETLNRRLAKIGKVEDISFNSKPDLIVVDGGKGQLNYAFRARKENGMEDIAFVSLAKREEIVFMEETGEGIALPLHSTGLKLLMRIRDEAHRFAITHHRNLRLKTMTESNLTKIEGIGKAKAKALLAKFKKIENLANATSEELLEVNGINEKLAINIINYFRSEKNEI